MYVCTLPRITVSLQVSFNHFTIFTFKHIAILFRFACDPQFIISLIEKSLLVLSVWLDLCGCDSVGDFTRSGSREGCTCVTVHRALRLSWKDSSVYMAFVWKSHISDFHSGAPLHSSSYSKQLLESSNQTGCQTAYHHLITCQHTCTK